MPFRLQKFPAKVPAGPKLDGYERSTYKAKSLLSEKKRADEKHEQDHDLYKDDL